MEHLTEYVKHHWFQIAIDIIAGMNVVVAGAKAMGWKKIADECTKVENAIGAMVQAALNRGGSNVKTDNLVGPNSSGDSSVKPS